MYSTILRSALCAVDSYTQDQLLVLRPTDEQVVSDIVEGAEVRREEHE